MAAEYAASKAASHKQALPTFGDGLAEYIKEREPILSPATIREYKNSQKNYDDIKDIPIQEITQRQIQDHINRFAVNHSPKSVRNNHGIITAVLKKYRPDFALNTVLPQKLKPDLYIPSDSDIKAILETAKGTEMELPILLAAFGPMRRGEICALHSENIEGNRVHVCRNMVMDSNKKFIIKQPKSYAGNRFIDYPDFVAEKFKGITGNITTLNPTMITSRFNHILIHARVPHFRFHDLRHYCASIMHAIGIPDAYIMERGGWGNDSTLKAVYRHALDEKSKEMSNKTNEYFSNMQHEMQHEKEKVQ
ncbi:MAG: tyrosine-type recombinase/integrase [Lachnospiraceae bacterium]|nr:tyrosine-type recombinase/integrase [Lachnospiraceae bacterium]